VSTKGCAVEKSVFVLLIGDSEGQPVDLYQRLQESDAALTARAAGVKVEVVWATNFEQYGQVRRRFAATPPDGVIVEPASVATAGLILGYLKGRTGLVLLNAWDRAFEDYRSAWGQQPLATISQPQAQIGEIQGRQLSGAAMPQGAQVLVVTGPMRSSAAQTRLDGLRSSVRKDIVLHTTEAGQWTEPDGVLAFNSWYGVFRSRKEEIHAIVAQSDDLAIGAQKAAQALANPAHVAMFRSAQLFGAGAVPGYGRELVDNGTLTASVTIRPNAGQAIAMLKQFWADGRPLPARSESEALPYPASSVGKPAR